MRPIFCLLACTLLLAAPARTEGVATLCTLVVEPGIAAPLLAEGDCDTRVTPASTFKIALAVMAADAGLITAPDAPALPFKEGYVDWNPAWRATTAPDGWMRNSVVWYSYELTKALGAQRFEDYVRAFDYGNGDVSGDPGAGNSLTGSWIGSSLAISPREQVGFLTRLLGGEIAVAPEAVALTRTLVDQGEQPNGWRLFAKTGAAAPKRPDGKPDRARSYGWYVGWAEKGNRRVFFARLVQNQGVSSTPPSFRARDGVRADLFSATSGLLR